MHTPESLPRSTLSLRLLNNAMKSQKAYRVFDVIVSWGYEEFLTNYNRRIAINSLSNSFRSDLKFS